MGSEHKGTSTVSDFFATARERHHIWLKRKQGGLYPWTTDEIFGRYKFTNVFRELDRGTPALRRMLPTGDADLGRIVYNVSWYRMLNREEHSRNPGLSHDADDLSVMLTRKKSRGEKIFTGCHMHSGDLRSNLQTFRAIFRERDEVAAMCEGGGTLEGVFDHLTRTYQHVGRFIGYEIVTDLRHYAALWGAGQPTDVDTWANVGPGSKRGMERLGMPPTLESMVELLAEARRRARTLGCLESHIIGDEFVRFELREIEHWLCEFDKYERARLGQGKPKQVYRGPREAL